MFINGLIGLGIGVVTFLIIGVLHPVVIKAEYYLGVKVWPAFLVGGIICIAIAFIVDNIIASAILGVAGFSLIWGIKEIFEQRDRVRKGWFPANPKRPED
jgi:hypothetical protein